MEQNQKQHIKKYNIKIKLYYMTMFIFVDIIVVILLSCLS